MSVKSEEMDLNNVHRKDSLQMEFYQVKDHVNKSETT